MTKPALFLAAVSFFTLSACGTSVDPAEALDAVRLTEKAHHDAIAAKDLDGVKRKYADNATLMLPDTAPASGRDAVGATYEAWFADPNFAIDLTEGPGWAASSGDLAVTTYTAQVTMTDESGRAVTVPVANQTVWRRADGAPWQIVSDFNAELPVRAAGN